MAFDPVTLGAAVQLAKAPATIKASVEDWLDDHPEATTTVQDGSITKAKLDSNLQATVDDVSGLKSAVADLEEGSLSALGATAGQVPTADGDGSWEWATPSGGGGDVMDVQVNGVSVLDAQGVANVPLANINGTPGAVKIVVGNGIGFSGQGNLSIAPAISAAIKNGTNGTTPIVPALQHESVFYGLAKAAGDTAQSESSNAVGQYTDAAKSAIQTMLGVSGIIASVEGATASKPYAIGDAFLHGGALYKASAAIAAGDAIVPGTNCTQTTIIEMLKGA